MEAAEDAAALAAIRRQQQSGEGNATITAAVLQSAFEHNKPAASKQYHGQTLVVTGKVDEVMQSQRRGDTALSFQTGGDHYPICIFPDSESNVKNLKPVNKGDIVTISGTCKGMGGDGDNYVILEQCVLKSRRPADEADRDEASNDRIDPRVALRATQARDAKLKALRLEMETEGLDRQEYSRRVNQIMREYRDGLQRGK